MNGVGLMLGNGFYNQHARDIWYFHHAPWRSEPKAILQVRITFKDGTVKNIVTDSLWKCHDGPVVFNGIRNGEFYDARLQLTGWSKGNFDESEWKKACEVAAPNGVLVAQKMPPVRVTQTLPCKRLIRQHDGTALADFGQNFAGWVRVKVKGHQGETVKLQYSERLAPAGVPDQGNINGYVFQGAFQEDHYTMRGNKAELWEPRFVYHGFRYVQISGLKNVKLIRIEGRVAQTDFKQTGQFACSDTLFNRIQENTLWSYRSNFLGIPTDCPQREKNGWLADAHLSAETGMYNFENTAGYIKWITDLQDSQNSTGQLPGIAPTPGWGYDNSGGPVWESALELMPWYLLRYRNDTTTVIATYPSAQRHLNYLKKNSTDYLLNFGLGDWLAIVRTPSVITSTAYFYNDAMIMRNFARLLHKKVDEEEYLALAGHIKASFMKHFIDESSGKIGTGTQTAQLVGLFFNLVEDDSLRKKILERLVEDIHQHQDHFTIGAIGEKMILHVLSEEGYPDLAFKLAKQTTYPSWGYEVTKGATTGWEDWKGEGSLNHIYMQNISTWFYNFVAGIRLDSITNAFRHSVIAPCFFSQISWAQASILTPYGTLASAWKMRTRKTLIDLTIPVNTTSSLYLQVKPGEHIYLVNHHLHATRLHGWAAGKNYYRFEFGSGTYHLAILR